MSKELQPTHLDSRRDEDSDRKWRDYCVKLDDIEAIESSPFRAELEGLRDFGFDTVIMGHPPSPEGSMFDDDLTKWVVYAQKYFPNTEEIVHEQLGGNLFIDAEVGLDSARSLSVGLGAGDSAELPVGDIQEKIWLYLEIIQKILLAREGEKIPLLTDNTH